MNMKYARGMAVEFGNKHPEHKQEIEESYSMMLSEIEDGETEEREIELFIDYIKVLDESTERDGVCKHGRDY
jgi:hypothetical protein